MSTSSRWKTCSKYTKSRCQNVSLWFASTKSRWCCMRIRGLRFRCSPGDKLEGELHRIRLLGCAHKMVTFVVPSGSLRQACEQCGASHSFLRCICRLTGIFKAVAEGLAFSRFLSFLCIRACVGSDPAKLPGVVLRSTLGVPAGVMVFWSRLDRTGDRRVLAASHGWSAGSYCCSGHQPPF